jgi:Phycobilisome protein
MLKTAKVAETAAANRLIKHWTARYLPDLSQLPTERGEFPTAQLVEAASLQGRSKTVKRARQLLQVNCERAGLETHDLLSYIPNVVNLADARRISQSVVQVYEKAFAIYACQPPPSYYLRFIDTSGSLFSKLALSSITLPAVQTLAAEVEPALLHLQGQHLSATDSRVVGFITTTFHLTTKSILKQLSLCEQILLSPYLKFVEEQSCIPWQRLCAAAASYPADSPLLALVEQLLEKSHAIAHAVYDQALQTHPHHRSRRGSLQNQDVMISTLRDINMFQGYLWLCVLENNMAAIEQELLPLCVAVFPSIDVQWELVEAMLKQLEIEIHSRISSEQSDRLRPFTESLRKLFVPVPTVA